MAVFLYLRSPYAGGTNLLCPVIDAPNKGFFKLLQLPSGERKPNFGSQWTNLLGQNGANSL